MSYYNETITIKKKKKVNIEKKKRNDKLSAYKVTTQPNKTSNKRRHNHKD